MAARFYASVQFADDVRFERDGKAIIIGAYDAELMVADFTTKDVFRIYAVVKIFGSLGGAEEPPIINIWLNDKKMLSLELREESRDRYIEAKKSFEKDYGEIIKKFRRDNSSYVINAVVPIELEQLHKISVVYVAATVAGKTIPAGTLIIDASHESNETID